MSPTAFLIISCHLLPFSSLLFSLLKLFTSPMEQARPTNFPRKLDFNLPLISTRRLGHVTSTSSRISFQDTTNGIPFCWEQTPGKPKNISWKDTGDSTETPRPRPPPCRWQPQELETMNSNHVNEDNDNCCGGRDQEVSDVFSDAVEVLSLTQAIDMVERAEENENHNHGLESVNCRDNGDDLCRNYMMERFLPDATALAASSALYAANNLTYKVPNSYSNYDCGDRDYVSQSCSSQLSHKGCGFEMFFRWRIKHKLCGVKSPIRQVSPHVRHGIRSSTNNTINRVIKKHI